MTATRKPVLAPLSVSQQGMWIVEQLVDGASPFVLRRCWTVRGAIDADALRKAATALARRHEALRTLVVDTPQRPIRVTLPEPRDFLTLGGEIGEFFATPFDLSRSTGLRLLLTRDGLTRDDRGTVLALAVHHMFCDGESLGPLLAELSEAYESALATGEARISGPVASHGDYDEALRARLTSPEGRQALERWRERLTPAPPPSVLPADRPRPATWSFRGATTVATLPPDLVATVDAWARRFRVTPFTVLLTGLSALVARSAGQDDVTLGVMTSGRHLAGPGSLIGMTANPVPVRCSTELTTFSERARQVADSLAAAVDDGWVPFQSIVERCGIPRDPSIHPLFQILVSYLEDGAVTAPRLGGATVEAHPGMESWMSSARSDLMFELVRTAEGGLRARLEYGTDLYDRGTAERILGRLTVVLQEGLAHPDRPLRLLPLASPEERRALLERVNETAKPIGAMVPALIARRAAARPDALAVVGNGGRLTYRELDERAGRLAGRLRAAGVRRGSPVGVGLDRTPELVVALLAIWRAGGAYVPLDPSYPPERLAYMIADSGVQLTLSQTRHATRLSGAEVILLDEPHPEVEPEPGWEPHPEDLSHVIYTSGSTGRPKGVQVTHRAVTNLVQWAIDYLPPRSLRGVLASTSLNFDLSVFELFTPLVTGDTVVLVDSLFSLAQCPPPYPVTLVNTVPSVMTELLRAHELPRSVRYVTFCGEPLPRRLVGELRERSGVRVCNLYGPSETTTYSTAAWIGDEPDAPVSIGGPLDNTRVYVLDSGLNPVPAGLAGELFIAGDALARGYCGRPGLTAERFVADPFGGGRMYRTGDRVRWGADGLEFLGRLDGQAKVRGFRVEPGELEAALEAHPAVHQACAVIVDGGTSDAHIVAHVTGADLDEAALRAHLADRLPAYLLPSRIVALDEFPTTANGKIDRTALTARARGARAPAPHRPAGPPGTAAPRGTSSESIVATLWSETLGVTEIDPERNFFEYGGTSYQLTRIHAGLRARHRLGVGLMALFRFPTVRTLADHLDEVGHEERNAV